MTCPHLQETPYLASANANGILACKAHNMQYIPSIGELELYCRNRRHNVCPFYIYDVKCRSEEAKPPGP